MTKFMRPLAAFLICVAVMAASMGTWSSWTVASRYPNHKAVVLQCGEVFPKAYYDNEQYTFNNVLLLQARYDEFENFRDYRPAVAMLAAWVVTGGSALF